MVLDPLLAFQRQVLDGLLDEDALCVVARGLGLNRILAELARVCATPRALVFLLNASDQDEDDLQHYFMQMRSGETTDEASTVHIIKNETNATLRAQVYRQGGLISVTSRILIVDLLNNVVPSELITGVIVHNASRVTAESIEAFVLRVIRQQNEKSFVKALSDAPETFTVGFAPMDKTLKVLGLRHVQLWPRFHVVVQNDLSRVETPVVELRQPQTRAMIELQQAVLDCLSAMISELCSTTKLLDSETFNVESSLFRYFDSMVKRRLNPYWHRLSGRARGMVGDLTLLRRVAELITTYDSVSLLEYLDTLLLSAKSAPGALPGPAASWMGTDSANILYSVARSRTFVRAAEPLPESTQVSLRRLGLPDNIVPVLEVPPKLEVLASILDEIGVLNHAAVAKGVDAGPVLVMASSARECRMIRSYLSSLHDYVELDIPQQYSNGNNGGRHPKMMVNLLRGFFKWKAQASGIRGGSSQSQRPGSITGSQNQQRSGPITGSQNQLRNAPPAKRRRMRGASAAAGVRGPRAQADVLEQESSDLANNIAAQDSTDMDSADDADEYLDSDDWTPTAFDEHFGLLANAETIVVHSYAGERGVLTALQPTHVVMFAPDAAFIRQVEMYRAHSDRLQQVYFLVYDNSLEEQRYLSAMRREREAFERLIGDKAKLVVPLDERGTMASPGSRLLQTVANRTLRSARNAESTEPATVVVDVREFRAPLASLLHAAGFHIVPRTLDVGDYVLHDDLVVERKSLPDLIGSLRSGRLFNQAAAMTRHYTCAALLVEFEVNASFSLQTIGGLTDTISPAAVSSQLSMLTLAFPRLRVLWSSSPYETVSIFAELKQGRDEPDAERAVRVGQDDMAVERDSLYSAAPVALLQAVPGVTLKNYQILAQRFRSMREVCDASRSDLEQLLDAGPAKQIYEFLHQAS
ncbi:DNA repair protein RAD16 [Coemansia sp. RSA 1822]|nr:DNA repair protein RAD16 [Coemansia sp. RSA 638]KAJ2559608.1 DNA repair protein RAD16 [Coemansia sp. RSA 1822]